MGQEGVHVCVLDLPGRMLYVRSTIEPGGDDAINFVGSFVFIFIFCTTPQGSMAVDVVVGGVGFFRIRSFDSLVSTCPRRHD